MTSHHRIMKFSQFTGFALTLGLASFSVACGVSDLYPKRKAKCKVNCAPAEQAREADGTARTSMGLPLTADHWIKATPLVRLSDDDVLKLIISNPLTTVAASDPSFSPLGSSVGATLTKLDKSIVAASAITDERRQQNAAVDCYRKQFEKEPQVNAASLSYSINPGLCFSLDQLQQALVDSSDEGSTNAVAMAYEDATSITIPIDQVHFSLTGQGIAQRLVDFGQSALAPFLPLSRSAPHALRIFDLARLEANGVKFGTSKGQLVHQLSWNFSALTGLPGETGFRIIDSTPEGSEATVWTFRGNLVDSAGVTQDAAGLKVEGAAASEAYLRIVTFNDFRVTFEHSEGDWSSSQPPAPVQAFQKGTNAKLSGSFTISIPQPTGTLRFLAVGLDEPCVVGVFAGIDPSIEDNSLGVLDLCGTSATGL